MWFDFMGKVNDKFFTQVTVDERGCVVIIDDFCCHLMSTYAVEKLGLSVVDHQCPHTIWRHGRLISITKQVLVSFSLGNTYKDSILCNVVHMDDCHPHFGNPWMSYRNVVNDPVKNYYRFVLEKRFVSVPLCKEQV